MITESNRFCFLLSPRYSGFVGRDIRYLPRWVVWRELGRVVVLRSIRVQNVTPLGQEEQPGNWR